MPLQVPRGAPTVFIRRPAYERAGFVRAALDDRLGLTDNEFRVEAEVVALGPIFDGEALQAFVDELERAGLVYYDDFFELTGNWPEWLAMFAGSAPGAGRNNPSQPHA